MFHKDPVIYIGYDQREQDSFDVLSESIHKRSSFPIHVVPLKQPELRLMGMYNRGFTTDSLGQKFDSIDKRPFSTEFSFTRFLTPILNQYSGWALFMDCDMYFRADPMELFDKYHDERKALYCVKHDYSPKESVKMDNQIQERYNRKNWSSLMLFNCGHIANRNLTVSDVNTKTGRWLHGMQWLPDESFIGELPVEWNWLDHWSDPSIEAKNVHFTTGGPLFPNWTPSNDAEQKYADEWRKLKRSTYYVEGA